MNKKFKLVTLLGIRPDIIRMFKLIEMLDANQEKFGYEHIYAHTGQHFDHELDQVFYEQLGVRKPDINLGVGKILKEMGGATTFEHQMAVMFPKITELIETTKPDAVMYLGDTNSVLSSVVVARSNVPVIHLEAGGRSFDWRMPEEKCRKICDHMSDLLYCYLPRHREILLSEGIDDFRIKVIGNIIYDAVERFLPLAEKSKAVEQYGLKQGEYIFNTMHREENTQNPEKLKDKTFSLIQLAEEYQLVWPLMPRVKNYLIKYGFYEKLSKSKVIVTPPLGYFETLKLQKEAKLIITDSGTIQEESLILGVPCLVNRLSTERPETITAGASIMSDTGMYEHALKAMSLKRNWDRMALNSTGRSSTLNTFDDLMERIRSGFLTQSRSYHQLKASKLVKEAYGNFEN